MPKPAVSIAVGYQATAENLAVGTSAASSNLFQYDAVGNLTNRMTNRIDGLSNSWQTVFDAMNRPVASIDPLGRTNTFTSSLRRRRREESQTNSE